MRNKLTYNYIFEQFALKGYLLLDTNFKNSVTPMEYLCPKAHKGKIRWNNFKNGQRCYECYIIGQRYGYNEVKKFIEDLGYQLISENYIINKQKLEIICDKGHNIKMTFNKLKLGHKCQMCVYDSLRADYDIVKNFFKLNGCELLSETYNNCDEKLKFKCECGNISFISYYLFKKGGRCGCIKSHGEKKIKEFLTKNKTIYETQKSFSGCKNKQVLLFDFYVDNKFLIEFDGEQHFHIVKKFNIKSLENNKLHDKIKNEFCLKNNIKLLRISYREKKQLEKILTDYINNFDNNKEIITFTNNKIYEGMKKECGL